MIHNRDFQRLSQYQEEKERTMISNLATDIDLIHDQNYQSLFRNKGIRNARQVLQYIDQEYQRWLTSSDFPVDNNLTSLRSSTAIVSIGGADGSELKALMTELKSHYGILVEISPSAAAMARDQGIDVVIEGDVMDAASDVILQLIDWHEQGEISSVLISCQSVLHELPTRSSTFTRDDFLQEYFVPLLRRGLRVMFYAREPCPPENWSRLTGTVAIRLFGLDKEDVNALANYIAQELNIASSVNSTPISNDNTRAILPVVLAQELLFKMLYWESTAHFLYEMGEQLTSFQPENWLRSLEKMSMHSEFRYLATDHFAKLYKKEERFLEEPVAVNPHNNVSLDMPKCFVQLFASSALPNAISIQN